MSSVWSKKGKLFFDVDDNNGIMDTKRERSVGQVGEFDEKLEKRLKDGGARCKLGSR